MQDVDGGPYVLILNEEGIASRGGEQVPEIVRLRHPKFNDGRLFLFSPDRSTVMELMEFSDVRRSLFINQTIKSDCKMFLSTKVDPLFLILPYLRKSARCSPLDQTLDDQEFPNIQRVVNCVTPFEILQISDRRGDESLNAYIYNEEKTMEWLKKKIERVATVLKEKHVHVNSKNAASANFVKAISAQDSSESYLRYAIGIISEYLEECVTESITKFMNVPDEKEPEPKRKSSNVENEDPQVKKMKLEVEIETAVPVISKQEKKLTISAKEKARAKAASGSKSITSFFKKK